MSLTATWAITTEPEALVAIVGDRFAPLLSWTPTADAGEVRTPWSVLESLEIDFAASTSALEAWAAANDSPLLLVGMFDSDGADVGARGSGAAMRALIGLEGYAGSLFPGYAPFDDDGNMLEGAALKELEAAADEEFRQVCADLRAASQTSSDAAAALHGWAHDSGLAPAAIQQIETILDSREVLAEDAVRSLIGALGLRSP